MSWRDVVASPEWRAAVEASVREVGSRVEIIDTDDVHVCDLPIDEVQVSMKGEVSERWAATFRLSDATYVPLREDDTLHPLSGMRARTWWRVRGQDGQWMEVLICTLMLEDPDMSDDGMLSYTIQGVDPLAEAKRGGYRDATLDLGGLTVDAALTRIFATVAPLLPVRIPTTTITLPAVYVVGEQAAVDDWTAIAALAGWVVRTDRDGAITVGPAPTPEALRASWQEGQEGCVVLSFKRNLKTSAIFNRVIAMSTSTEVTAPIREIAEDDDPGSQTWVGRYGPYTYTIRSDKITTAEGARNMARAELDRWRRPLETVSISIPARPDLDEGDLVALGRARIGIDGHYRISSWTWTASRTPAAMEVTMMQRQA